MVYEFHTYSSRNGKRPFDKWYKSLRNKELIFQIMRRLDRAELGDLGDYKFLGDGIYEFRIHYEAGYRIYFSLMGECLILLLGGTKNTQERDIKKVKEYWKDFRERLYE